MWYNQKRGKESRKRAQLRNFTHYSSKFRAIRTLHSPKQHVFLEFLGENKVFYFSERALRAGPLLKISG